MSSDDKIKCLTSLLAVAALPPITKGKAELELAELLPGPELKQRRESLRHSARALLTQDHHHAALDIDFGLALENYSVSGELDVAILLQSYYKLDYPNGLRSWLHKLLDVATILHNYDLQDSIEKDLEALALETGTLCLAKVLQVNRIARFHQKTGNDDLVKATLQKLYHELSIYDIPFTLGHTGFILTDIFIRYRDGTQALQWAHACDTHWRACPATTQSMGSLQVLRSKILIFETSGDPNYQPIMDFCDGLIDSDLTKGLREEAALKLDTILGMFYTCKAIPRANSTPRIHDCLTRIETVLESITDRDTRMSKAAVLQQKATFYMSLGTQRTDVTMEQNALTGLHEALEMTHAASDRKLTYQLIVIREQIGLVHHTLFKKLRRTENDESRRCLAAAEEDFGQCLRGYEAISSTFQIAEVKYWIALLQYEAWIEGWQTPDPVLDALLQAEVGYDNLRNEISISTGLSAIKDKQALAKQKHVRDLYRFAFQLCIREGHLTVAWQWAQKAKARSLSDILGLGCLVPESLLAQILADSTARKLYDRERELLQLLQKTTPDQTFGIGVELRELQKEMRSIPELRALLDLRQGKAITAEELITRWHDLPVGGHYKDVCFVDWYVLGDEDIYILILRQGKEPFVRKLGVSVSDVWSWISVYLRGGEMQAHSIHRSDDHPSQALRNMDALVEMIGDHADAETLLVLSPPAPLDALPLHALRVQQYSEGHTRRSIPLIERNPLVYCSNLTVFIQCCELAAAKKPQPQIISTYMAVYEGTPTETCDLAEQQTVYGVVNDLATETNASATTGLSVTCEKIFADWPSSDFVLFFGHCDSSSQDITRQSLILKTNCSGSQAMEHSTLSVTDIFDLKLQSPLVSLLACGSSQQKLQAGDEPLGLVTAFLCAGAASVIGTLWPVTSGTARLFLITLVQKMKLVAPSFDEEPLALNHILDLTVVFQQTVRHLRRNSRTRTPYHWAAFVLHGSTFMRASQPAAI